MTLYCYSSRSSQRHLHEDDTHPSSVTIKRPFNWRSTATPTSPQLIMKRLFSVSLCYLYLLCWIMWRLSTNVYQSVSNFAIPVYLSSVYWPRGEKCTGAQRSLWGPGWSAKCYLMEQCYLPTFNVLKRLTGKKVITAIFSTFKSPRLFLHMGREFLSTGMGTEFTHAPRIIEIE